MLSKHDGLSKQLKEAKKILTFIPSIMTVVLKFFACCTRWYKVQIRAMLTDTSLYEECGFRLVSKCAWKWSNVGLLLHKECPICMEFSKPRNENGGQYQVLALKSLKITYS